MKRRREKMNNERAELEMKRRVRKSRARARFVGMILLFAIIGLTVAVALLPMLTGGEVRLTAISFWKVFKKGNAQSGEGLTKLVAAGLYGLLLFVAFVHFVWAFIKLKKLFKNKSKKKDGFNHAAYAMQGLGRLFSRSFSLSVSVYFSICLLYPDAKPTNALLLLLGAGVLVHLFTGVVGGKVSYFRFEEETLTERKREVGRAIPFFRNVLQLAGVFAMLYFLLQANAKTPFFHHWISRDFVEIFTGNVKRTIVTCAQLATLLCVFVLLTHATGIAEYGIDGARGKGMKIYRVFSLLTFFAVGIAIGGKLLQKQGWDFFLLTVAGIAFVSFLIEMILRKLPRVPKEEEAQAQAEKEAQEIASAPVLFLPTQEESPLQSYAYTSYYPVTMSYAQQPSAPSVRERETTAYVPSQAKQDTERTEIVRIEVNCPFCGRRLRVNSAIQYHRCPICQRVFAIHNDTKK